MITARIIIKIGFVELIREASDAFESFVPKSCAPIDRKYPTKPMKKTYL